MVLLTMVLKSSVSQGAIWDGCSGWKDRWVDRSKLCEKMHLKVEKFEPEEENTSGLERNTWGIHIFYEG